MTKKHIYTVGGTIQAGIGIYIERKADRVLLELCRAGKFAYVLTARQMGKSSLMERTAQQLKAEGIASVTIDLSQLGSHLAAEQWYIGLLAIINDKLSLQIDLLDWWNSHRHLGMVHRLTLFLQKLLLAKISTPVVIFIDEIDTTLSLPYADDFYIAIRYLFNARSEHPEFKRLSFVLIGVATPTDLIADPQRTPFNIGQRVDLSDFTRKEALPLAQGFDLSAEKASKVLHWVFKWTGGHPYLSQRLCQEISSQRRRDWSETEIDRLVTLTFFDEMSAGDMNLLFIQNMLTKQAPDKLKVLLTYRQIRSRRRPVKDEEQSVVKTHLKLSGVVKRKKNFLIVRNLIYRKTFNVRWIKENLPIDLVKLLRRTIIGLIIAILALSLPLTFWALKSKARAVKLNYQANYLLAKLFEEKAGSALKEAFQSKQAADFQKAWLYTLEALHQDIGNDRRLPLSIGRLLSLKLQTAALSETWTSPIFTPMPTAIAFSPDGKYIASAAGDNKVWLWETESGEKLAAFSGHKAAVLCIAFSPNGKLLASGSGDNDIRMWDAKSGENLFVLSEHTDDVWSVAFSTDSKILASGSGDNSLRLWDTISGKPLAVFPDAAQDILSVAFSPNGKWIAIASRDNCVHLWDIEAKKRVQTFSGHTDDVWSIAFSSDSRRIISGSGDNTIKLWDVQTGALLRTLSGHTDDVLSVTFNPDNNRIVSGSVDKTICLWDANSGEKLAIFSGHQASVYSVAFSPDGKRIVSGAGDNSIRIWDATSGENLTVLSGHTDDVWGIAFSADGKYLVSASGDSSVRLWDIRSQKPLRIFRGHTDYVWCVAFDPASKKIASGSADNTIRIWDTNNGEQLAVFSGHADDIWSIAFSTDGSRLVSGSSDNSIRLWDVKSGKQLAVFSGHSDDVLSVAFSPDGKWIASGAWDNSIRLWNAENGKQEAILAGHKVAVLTIAFSPDGKFLASGAADNTIRIWDLQRREPTKTLLGHTDAIWSVTFDPHGKYLTSGSSDNTLRLWDLSTGDQLVIFWGHTNVVWSVTFSPDGNWIASSSGDNMIRLNDIRLLTDYEFVKRKTEIVRRIYDGSYYLLPFRLEEQNLIPRKPRSRQIEQLDVIDKEKFKELQRPRPIERSPVEWLLERME
jgi:WD40 repeat protein